MTCQTCRQAIEESSLILEAFTDRLGRKQVRGSCPYCLNFVKFVRHVSNDDFMMPFGKHKGKALTIIARSDRDYLIWLSDQAWLNMGLRNRILEVLS